jgi:hypothetical protein
VTRPPPNVRPDAHVNPNPKIPDNISYTLDTSSPSRAPRSAGHYYPVDARSAPAPNHSSPLAPPRQARRGFRRRSAEPVDSEIATRLTFSPLATRPIYGPRLSRPIYRPLTYAPTSSLKLRNDTPAYWATWPNAMRRISAHRNLWRLVATCAANGSGPGVSFFSKLSAIRMTWRVNHRYTV